MGEVGRQDGSFVSLVSVVESIVVKKEVVEKSYISLMDNKWKFL